MGAAALKKQVAESRKYTMDFSPNMASSETISSVTSVTATPTGLTIGTPAIVGQTVEVQISVGTNNTLHHVVFKIVTSAANTLVADGWLQVHTE